MAGTITCTLSSYDTTETMSCLVRRFSAEMAPWRAFMIFSPCIDPERSMAKQRFTSGRLASEGTLAPNRLTRRKAVLRRPASTTGFPRPASRTAAALSGDAAATTGDSETSRGKMNGVKVSGRIW